MLAVPSVPIIDNVTGRFLPTEAGELRPKLAAHLNSAVRWDAGIKTIIAGGATSLVEMGFGNTLTKFGFFIDRSVEHQSFYPALSGV